MRKYISAEEVFNRVATSLKTYFDRDVIIAEEYYKVIEHCNSILGLRLNPNKEIFVEPIDNKIKLPEDFLMLNLALAANVSESSHTYKVKKETLTGRQPAIEERMDIRCGKLTMTCGKIPEIIVEEEEYTTTFREVHLLSLKATKYATDDCINLNAGTGANMVIENGYIYTDLDACKVYINYIASMYEDGIPLCLDHPIIMQYYEQALKYQMLVDLLINKKLEIVQVINLVRQEMVGAKNDAITLVTTPEYDEMRSINNALRRLFRRYQFL